MVSSLRLRLRGAPSCTVWLMRKGEGRLGLLITEPPPVLRRVWHPAADPAVRQKAGDLLSRTAKHVGAQVRIQPQRILRPSRGRLRSCATFLPFALLAKGGQPPRR